MNKQPPLRRQTYSERRLHKAADFAIESGRERIAIRGGKLCAGLGCHGNNASCSSLPFCSRLTDEMSTAWHIQTIFTPSSIQGLASVWFSQLHLMGYILATPCTAETSHWLLSIYMHNSVVRKDHQPRFP